jgi:hypothetical protein
MIGSVRYVCARFREMAACRPRDGTYATVQQSAATRIKILIALLFVPRVRWFGTNFPGAGKGQ